MSNPGEALAVIIWIALGIIAVVALAVGWAVFYYTDNGIAGLASLLLVAAAGLALLRFG